MWEVKGGDRERIRGCVCEMEKCAGWLDDGCVVMIPPDLVGPSSSMTASPQSSVPTAASKKTMGPASLPTLV